MGQAYAHVVGAPSETGGAHEFCITRLGRGTVAIVCVSDPRFMLRLDGQRGVVNAQYFARGAADLRDGTWERFRLHPLPDGCVAIQSVQFPDCALGLSVSLQRFPLGSYVPRMVGHVHVSRFEGAATVGQWARFRIERVAHM